VSGNSCRSNKCGRLRSLGDDSYKIARADRLDIDLSPTIVILGF
jgi:hypothetical protein